MFPRLQLGWLLLSLLPAACSSRAVTADCREADKPCPAPFTCAANEQGDLYTCRSPAGDVPGCRGQPPGQFVLYALTTSGIPTHWLLSGGCIAVSYAPELASAQGAIAAGVSAWTGLGCTGLCFGNLQMSSTPPEGSLAERRIHFAADEPTDDSRDAETSTFYEDSTGRIVTASIVVRSSRLAALQPAHFARLFGFALGFTGMPPYLGVPGEPQPQRSLFEPAQDPPEITAPTDQDRIAYCKLYGPPSYCGE